MRPYNQTGVFSAMNQLSALSGNIAQINPKVTVDTRVAIAPKTYLILAAIILAVVFLFKKKSRR
jgi:hypothetical protein